MPTAAPADITAAVADSNGVYPYPLPSDDDSTSPTIHSYGKRYTHCRVFSTLDVAREFIGADFAPVMYPSKEGERRTIYQCRYCTSRQCKLLIHLVEEGHGDGAGFAVHYIPRKDTPCINHVESCWSRRKTCVAGEKSPKGLPPTIRTLVRQRCEAMLSEAGATVASVKPAKVRDQLLNTLENNKYFLSGEQRSVMKDKIMTCVDTWRKEKRLVVKKKIGAPPCIDMVAKLKKFTEEHKLCPKRDAVLPVRPPPSCQDEADHVGREIFGLQDFYSQAVGREEMRPSNVFITFPLPVKEWVDEGIISQNLWNRLERTDKDGTERQKLVCFGSLALMQNAVDAWRKLHSVVLGSVDTTFNVAANGWKLGAVGAYSSKPQQSGNTFVPYFFFLCPEETAASSSFAATAFVGAMKRTYNIDVDFKAGNVSDRASAFANMWDIVFPNSPRGQCWTHFKLKFCKSSTTFRRKPVQNYCKYIKNHKPPEWWLLNVAAPDVDHLRLGKTQAMSRKIWELIRKYLYAMCIYF